LLPFFFFFSFKLAKSTPVITRTLLLISCVCYKALDAQLFQEKEMNFLNDVKYFFSSLSSSSVTSDLFWMNLKKLSQTD